MVFSPLIAATATFALKAGLWFRRGRLAMVFSSLAASCCRYAENPLIPAVQIPAAASSMTRLDETDRRILRALQKDGRMQNIELAAQVGLSPSPCLRRVKALEEAGVIQRYAAVLNPAEIGMGMTVFARVWLTGQDVETVNHFTNTVSALPQIVECHLMAGNCDFLLRVVARDLDDYRQFQIDHLTRIKGVQNVKSDIPMQKI